MDLDIRTPQKLVDDLVATRESLKKTINFKGPDTPKSPSAVA